jgi:hypothetical protein
MPVLFAVTGVDISQVHDHAVGWGTLTLINAGLAQSKNRSGLAWWFVSLFLGPIATFLLVVLDKVETPPVPYKTGPTPEL